MQARPEKTRHVHYDAVTIAVHWTTALLVLALFVLALWPGVVKGAITLHKSIGLLLLALVVLRVAWRLSFGRKSHAAAAEPTILQLAAKGAHVALYALLIITPLLGWLYQDARGNVVEPFGLELPMLSYYDHAFSKTVYEWKKIAAYSLLALVFGHAVAALGYHSVIRKDGVLNSILPRRFRRNLPA